MEQASNDASCNSSLSNTGLKTVIIASSVDHGTSAIVSAFVRELQPEHVILMQRGTRSMRVSAWLELRAEIREKTKNAEAIVCLNHGAVLAGGILLGHQARSRTIGILEWSRQYPSRRKDLKTRVYAWFFQRILKRYSTVCSPVAGMREFYASAIPMLPVLYPLPYPEVDPSASKGISDQHPRMLFIGADIQRKGGDILLRNWQTDAPADAELTFVTPAPPVGHWRNVRFLHDIAPFTPEHRKLLEDHTIFVLPSHRESYGFAALEALNFGHVVVTTSKAGIAGLVAEAGGIIGETPDDAVRLAIDLLRNPAEIVRRREHCRGYMAAYRQRFHQLLDAALQGSQAE